MENNFFPFVCDLIAQQKKHTKREEHEMKCGLHAVNVWVVYDIVYLPNGFQSDKFNSMLQPATHGKQHVCVNVLVLVCVYVCAFTSI